MDLSVDDFKALLLENFALRKELAALQQRCAELEGQRDGHGSHEHEHVTPFGPPHHHDEGEPRGV